MGAWGYGIRQDDFVMDVIGAFEDLVKAGNNIRQATEAVRSKFAADLKDSDDGPLFWIALADMQWTYGELEPPILDRVKEDLDSGRSLAAWTEDQRKLARRKVTLEKFISKISQPNRRPRKHPQVVVRAPEFRSGDCLSIRLPDGQYAAALVLVADHALVEYGRNLVGVLDYLSPEKPALDDFVKRTWLALRHHGGSSIDVAWYYSMGFRAAKDRIQVIGRVEIVDSDPKESNFFRRWTRIGERAE